MAQLPNGARARIPLEKFTDDCLNPDHPGEVGVRLELLGTMCRRKQALQRRGHCFRHLVDFLEDVLGTWGGVPRELVAAQRAPRILPRCETLTRPLPGARRAGVGSGAVGHLEEFSPSAGRQLFVLDGLHVRRRGAKISVRWAGVSTKFSTCSIFVSKVCTSFCDITCRRHSRRR